MPHPLFILGAPDPEMARIETILRRVGADFLHARGQDGLRVIAGQAYIADSEKSGVPSEPRLTLIECDFAQPIPPGRLQRIDHHRPGDPGYEIAPAEYWRGSSLGQLCALLNIEPDAEDYIAAASDHCLAAAYAGACPGVAPAAVRAYRLSARAHATGKTAAEIASSITTALEALHAATDVDGLPSVRDLRGPFIPELPDAACEAGFAYLATLAHPDGERILLGGAVPAATVEFFLRHWAAEKGLHAIYGVPARGYAGGLLTHG